MAEFNEGLARAPKLIIDIPIKNHVVDGARLKRANPTASRDKPITQTPKSTISN